MTTFERIAPRTSATVAAEQVLRRKILDGSLPPGSKLPPERELSQSLGVSRLTLRSALATLAAADLVEARQGSGYTVRDFRQTGGTDLLDHLVRMAEEARELPAAAADLLRIRRHLAAAVLDALGERPPGVAARRAVRAAIDRFAAVVDAGPDEVSIADLDIVSSLLDATGSVVLRVCLNPITAVVHGSAALRAAIYREPRTNLEGWRGLAVWLERPDAAAIPALLAVLAANDRATILRLARRSRSGLAQDPRVERRAR